MTKTVLGLILCLFLTSCTDKIYFSKIGEDLFYQEESGRLCRIDYKTKKKVTVLDKPWLVENDGKFDDITHNAFKNLSFYKGDLFFKANWKVGKLNVATKKSTYLPLNSKVRFFQIFGDQLYYLDDDSNSIYRRDFSDFDKANLFYTAKKRIKKFSVGNDFFSVLYFDHSYTVYDQQKNEIITYEEIFRATTGFDLASGVFLMKKKDFTVSFSDYKREVLVPLKNIEEIKTLKNGNAIIVQHAFTAWSNARYYDIYLIENYSVESFSEKKVKFNRLLKSQSFYEL